MNVRLAPSWKDQLQSEFDQPYFQELIDFVKQEYASAEVFPPGPLIFRALDECDFEDVRVVILGQDPYHGPGQANGLAFSVSDAVALPPSLVNIYKEIAADLKVKTPASGNLERWSKQGVLLLNATLTVRGGAAASHQGKGWEQFTSAIVKLLNDQREHLVFLLWGRYAQDKGKIIDTTKHLVLKAAHPSPLSAYNGFFGSRHFSRANEYLKSHNLPEINW